MSVWGLGRGFNGAGWCRVVTSTGLQLFGNQPSTNFPNKKQTQNDTKNKTQNKTVAKKQKKHKTKHKNTMQQILVVLICFLFSCLLNSMVFCLFLMFSTCLYLFIFATYFQLFCVILCILYFCILFVFSTAPGTPQGVWVFLNLFVLFDFAFCLLVAFRFNPGWLL